MNCGINDLQLFNSNLLESLAVLMGCPESAPRQKTSDELEFRRTGYCPAVDDDYMI